MVIIQKINKFLLFTIFFLTIRIGFSQEENELTPKITGNFETILQSYQIDTLIGISSEQLPDEKILSNSFLTLNYTFGKFSAGVKYEAYLNALQGYDNRYNGHGISGRFASYISDEIEITAGNFYEQFGNGLILRSFEERALGIDNSIDGMRVKYKPFSGIKLTGIIGKQRYYWEHGSGIVKGLDCEISLNQTIKKLSNKKIKILLGGGIVSKYQKNSDPVYNFPENVSAFSGRLNLSRNGFVLSSEFAYKINDPSSDNGLIFKDGNATFLNASWSKKGIGILISALRLDNMSFRSDRTASLNDLNINYLPAITKNHSYFLTSMYPFSTQANGQIGLNTEIFYTFKKNSFFGGKYGTNVNINFSVVNAIQKTKIIINPNADILNLDGYTSNPYAIGDENYYKDLNLEINKKLNKSLKFSLVYVYEDYNKYIIQGKDSSLHADIFVFDFSVKLSSKYAVRFESEYLTTNKNTQNEPVDFGNWIAGLIEFTYSPHWFITITDQYNTGNSKHDSAHYYNFFAGYTKGANRIQVGYGRQREGILCVGGICRNVPAASGFNLTLSSSF